ncbi:MAG: choice-of-anchor D domain-containing protein, partial [Planctomycetota bacterium]
MHRHMLYAAAAVLAALSLASASQAAQVPDIDVRGNGLSIPDGDTTPSVSDGADFGSAGGSTPVDHTFSIHNTGQADLTLSGSPDYVQITGANAGDFTVTAQPPSGSVAVGGSETFTVRFSPGALGLRVASIVIPSDDPDEGTYTFSIQGTG